MIEFVVFGEPVGKGRPRFTMSGRAYTPKKTKDYETKIREAFTGEMYPAGIPLKMRIRAYLGIPKSISKSRASLMCKGALRPLKTPDLDNIGKSIADALNGVAYADDKQIVQLAVEKWYSTVPRVEIQIDEVKW